MVAVSLMQTRAYGDTKLVLLPLFQGFSTPNAYSQSNPTWNPSH